MRTREIGRSQWNAYMASVSHQWCNRNVTLRILSDEWGDQVLAEHVPLLGIAPEEKGSEACAVDIELGRPGGTDTVMHEVACAETVRVREDDEGQPVALDIEGHDPESHAKITALLLWD